MKKAFLLILLAVSLNINAQAPKTDLKPYDVYCQVVGQLKISGTMSYLRFYWYEVKGRTKLVDEKGKVIDFRNILDAINYLGKRGWTYVDCQAWHDEFFYTLKKTVTSDEEAKEGIYIREDFD